jgi:hypothetical protein
VLKRHEARQSHQKNRNAVEKTAPTLFDIMNKEKKLESNTRTIELQVAMFIDTKNLPYAVADDLIELLKTIEISPQVQQKLRCRRTKVKALICNVIGEHMKKALVNKLS